MEEVNDMYDIFFLILEKSRKDKKVVLINPPRKIKELDDNIVVIRYGVDEEGEIVFIGYTSLQVKFSISTQMFRFVNDYTYKEDEISEKLEKIGIYVEVGEEVPRLSHEKLDRYYNIEQGEARSEVWNFTGNLKYDKIYHFEYND